MKRIQLHLLLALLALALALLLFGLESDIGLEAECVAYCETYWPGGSAQYQRCIEGCGR